MDGRPFLSIFLLQILPLLRIRFYNLYKNRSSFERNKKEFNFLSTSRFTSSLNVFEFLFHFVLLHKHMSIVVVLKKKHFYLPSRVLERNYIRTQVFFYQLHRLVDIFNKVYQNRHWFVAISRNLFFVYIHVNYFFLNKC